MIILSLKNLNKKYPLKGKYELSQLVFVGKIADLSLISSREIAEIKSSDVLCEIKNNCEITALGNDIYQIKMAEKMMLQDYFLAQTAKNNLFDEILNFYAIIK